MTHNPNEHRPYVGVVGVSNMEEQGAVVDLAIQQGVMQSNQTVMIGVKARYPIIDSQSDAPVIMTPGGNEDSGLTWAYAHCNVRGESSIPAAIQTVAAQGRNYLRGFKLHGKNWMADNHQAQLEAVKAEYSEHRLVLGLPFSVLIRNPAFVVAERLRELPIDYVSIDALPDDTSTNFRRVMSGYIENIRRLRPEMGIAFSGGLTAANVGRRLGAYVSNYANISCSAESALRAKNGLNVAATKDFIDSWLELTAETVDNTGHNL